MFSGYLRLDAIFVHEISVVLWLNRTQSSSMPHRWTSPGVGTSWNFPNFQLDRLQSFNLCTSILFHHHFCVPQTLFGYTDLYSFSFLVSCEVVLSFLLDDHSFADCQNLNEKTSSQRIPLWHGAKQDELQRFRQLPHILLVGTGWWFQLLKNSRDQTVSLSFGTIITFLG